MQRIAVEIGGFAIHWYGVMLAVGILLGMSSATRRAIAVGIQPEIIADLILWLVIGAIAGARSWYVLSHYSEFAEGPTWRMIDVRSGGLVYYGGFCGAVLGGWFFVWRRQLGFWELADVMAPSIPLGQFFGRLGCFMNGCCYGKATTTSLGIYFPYPHEKCDTAVHPTQLYEAALCLGLYCVLARLFNRRRFSGQVFCGYLLSYGVIRGAVEVFRGDYGATNFAGATPGQTASVIAAACGFALWRHLKLSADQTPAPRG